MSVHNKEQNNAHETLFDGKWTNVQHEQCQNMPKDDRSHL